MRENYLCISGTGIESDFRVETRVFQIAATTKLLPSLLTLDHFVLSHNTPFINNMLHISAFATPFRVSFNSDANEDAMGAGRMINEEVEAPGGILGFSLNYKQIAC